MSSKLQSLMRWGAGQADDVDTALTPKVNIVRGIAARATTPLLPDDYLKLLNPLWSARELRGVIVGRRSPRPRTPRPCDQTGVGLLRQIRRPVSTSASVCGSTGDGIGAPTR